MSKPDFLGRAIESVKKAIETDTAGDYAKAYQEYTSSSEWQQPQETDVTSTNSM
jgi:vacuolar protein-sorting-associated protein 4